jgi:cell division protein FtsI/penicillin-binding protein 2
LASPTRPGRVSILSRVIAGGFVIAALSQARVQIMERGSIIDRASETDRFVISRTEPARRGFIYTSDGKPLAQDEDTRVLNVDFRKVPHSPAFFMEVSAATGIPASEFLQLADSGMKRRSWRQPISAAQAKELQDVKTSWRADGISLAPSGRRSYPLAEATAGFVGVLRDGKAQGGLELGDDKLLAGVNGKKVGLVDRTGAFLPMRLDSKTQPRVDGENLTLTVDSELQIVASNSIRQAVEENKADQGVAIVMDPKTGDVLAMANWPSYNPNMLGDAQGTNQVFGFNPNYMAVLEPGSMFKILTLAKALDKGVLNESDTVYCHGTLAVGKRTISCDSHHGNRAHGLLDATLAIAKSCNVSAATWALRIGYDDYVKYMESLGIMSKTHIGLPGERHGLFNYNDPAQELHLATLGFGQSVNATPIELASAFATLGNGGRRMQPRLIKKIGAKETPIVPMGQIIRTETSDRVMKIMQSVIESDSGTGKDLRIPGYILGGKTGTAQKMNRQTHSMKGGGYVSNFVGFVPGDKPRAVILVMVDNPKAGKYYGATVAGPVFQQLAKSVIRRYGIAPSAPFTRVTQVSPQPANKPVGRLVVAPPAKPAEQVRAEMQARQDAKESITKPIDDAYNPDKLVDPADEPKRKPISKEEDKPITDLSDDIVAAEANQDQTHRRHRHRKGARHHHDSSVRALQ